MKREYVDFRHGEHNIPHIRKPTGEELLDSVLELMILILLSGAGSGLSEGIMSQILQKNVSGAIAELGVYRGEVAAILNRLFEDRTPYLFDSFEGFSQNDLSRERKLSRAAVADFHDTSIVLVRRRMTLRWYKEVLAGKSARAMCPEQIERYQTYVRS